MSVFKNLLYDLDSIKSRDPAARNRLEIFLLYSGFHAVVYYRIAHFFYKHGMKFIARLISQNARFLTGVEIHPGAKIGRGLLIDHGSGVVIGETAEIGNDCTIYQGVTLGGTGKDVGKRHPTVGNNVLIGAGAKVLGPFTVGDDAKIAAGAVVLDTVPPNSTAVGVPARIISRKKKEDPAKELDQVHIPDPVSLEICRLRGELEKLEKTVERLNGGKKIVCPCADLRKPCEKPNVATESNESIEPNQSNETVNPNETKTDAP